MNREQLAHILRAASTVTSDGEIIVLGSQSILATFDETVLPDEATSSMEADIAFAVDEGAAKADQVDGAIGEGSMFQQTFGIYGQGVELSTATLPPGWRDRLVIFDRPDAEPATARCLEPHDLVVAKLVAGREKDYRFVAALLAAGLVSADLLRERAAMGDELTDDDTARTAASTRSVFWTVALVFFLAEFGDKTMFATGHPRRRSAAPHVA